MREDYLAEQHVLAKFRNEWSDKYPRPVRNQRAQKRRQYLSNQVLVNTFQCEDNVTR